MYADSTNFPQTITTRLYVDFKNLYNDKRWNIFVAYLQNKKETYAHRNHYNIALKKELDQMWYDDQKGRYDLMFNEEYKKPSDKTDSLWKSISYFDSINLIKLNRLFDKYGWVSNKLVGNSSLAQWLIIQHSDTAVINKYLPLLKKEADSGEISKSNLALTIDRANIYNGKKQIYGSQITSENPSLHHPAYIKPLEEPDNVDKRRKEMGLEPIANYAKSFGIVWNTEEYKKMLPTYEKWEKNK